VTPSRPESSAAPRIYESVIKVNVTDLPEKRAQLIAEGIGYACALLMDEYGWSAERIEDVLERVTDEMYDQEAQRG
jgi:hypothetical protein